MIEPWQCRCGADGVRNLGGFGYCGRHLAVLYESFGPDVFSLSGVGLPVGRLRPEYGAAEAELRCCNTACGATWVGVPGDPCPWCRRAREAVEVHQREMLLRAPEPPTEVNLRAWGSRLRRAVEVHVVSEQEAQAAWRRAVARVVA